MSRLSVIQLAQLPEFKVLETLDAEATLTARMTKLREFWAANDPPANAQYDVDLLEFDPIKINQEASTYFELLMRDRVNQAAKAVTLAFGTGGDLDAIASRYPGGVPRLEGESDDRYRARIWLSPNLLSPHGTYEAYVFWGLTADPTLRDVSATVETGTPYINIAILPEGEPVRAVKPAAEWELTPFPSVTPTAGQIAKVRDYVMTHSRKGLTDVVQVIAPTIVEVDYSIRYWLFPGWDESLIRGDLFKAFAAMIERQRYLGYSYTEAAIEAALMIPGVSNIHIDTPVKIDDADDHDVLLRTNEVVVVNSVDLVFAGRSGIENFDVDAS